LPFLQSSESISESPAEAIAGMLFCNPLFKLPCEQRNKGEQFGTGEKTFEACCLGNRTDRGPRQP
jgi:hypothetical protein